MIFNLFFLMNVVSSWKVKSNFAHVKPHASNLLFVGILCVVADNSWYISSEGILAMTGREKLHFHLA